MIKRKVEEPQQEKTMLIIRKDDATSKLAERIEKGIEFRLSEIRSEGDFNGLTADLERWNEYNIDLLKNIFSNHSISVEYSRVSSRSLQIEDVYNPTPIPTKLAKEYDTLRDRVNKLASIKERLELFEEPKPNYMQAMNIVENNKRTESNNKVFIVHGRNEGVKQSVARFLEKLNLNPIILSEQPNGGKTVIDKFETNADVGFAVILLTPDDKGGLNEDGAQQKSRARQNVLFELGYFVGKLGRSRVCALYDEKVELPSDIVGVAYVQIDASSGWKFELAKELKSAGYTIDGNNLF